jgi:Domain of unknown function (DUF4833)
MLRCLLLSTIVTAFTAQMWAQDRSLPLFLIARSTNANVIHYEVQVNRDGRLDLRQPVIAYWVMAAEDGRRQPLNVLERTRAYGFTIRPDGSNDSYTMNLVSYGRRPIHVYFKDGLVHAETTIGGRRAFLTKIFITTRKSWLLNEPVSAELYGTDVVTGEPCYEKVSA